MDFNLHPPEKASELPPGGVISKGPPKIPQEGMQIFIRAIDLAGYCPSQDWQSFLSTSPASGHAKDRAAALEALAPSRPRA